MVQGVFLSRARHAMDPADSLRDRGTGMRREPPGAAHRRVGISSTRPCVSVQRAGSGMNRPSAIRTRTWRMRIPRGVRGRLHTDEAWPRAASADSLVPDDLGNAKRANAHGMTPTGRPASARHPVTLSTARTPTPLRNPGARGQRSCRAPERTFATGLNRYARTLRSPVVIRASTVMPGRIRNCSLSLPR